MMNEQIADIIALTSATIGVLLTFTSGVLIWTFKSQIKRIDNAEHENRVIKENYLDRFEEIKDIMNEHNGLMQQELSRVKTDIALIKQIINPVTPAQGISKRKGKHQ